MKRRAFLPLVTYPDVIPEAVALNAVAMAARLDASLDVLVLNVDIPEISNALSRFLLNTPELIRKTEATSRKRGAELLAEVRAEATRLGVASTDSTHTAAPAFLAEAAATQARYFDVALVGWQAGNETVQAVAQAVIFDSGRPTILLPEIASP